ncbi:Homeobox domain [Dillenia turbinata]|uniref:Homeobox domain n=1 Tax=Dillenia turbinata TaxID=194707 RepID=A0AAN8ZNS0_9MAGN
MEDQATDPNSSPNNGSDRNNEPVRSRWTPTREQISILESIFHSGMVNPPKEETVRIRKLLEKFGSVGDSNIFYWFQNRRSRSRRRQRRLQAAALAGDQQQMAVQQTPGGGGGGGGAIQCQTSFPTSSSHQQLSFGEPIASPSCSSYVGSSSSSYGGVVVGDDCGDDLFSMCTQMDVPEMEGKQALASILCPSNLHYESGFIAVYINGVATEVPRGSLDLRGIFGQDVILVHSSGLPVPYNEYGFSLQSLQHGESYFLVRLANPLLENTN